MKDLKHFGFYRTFTKDSLSALVRGKYDMKIDGEFLLPGEKGDYFVGVCNCFG